MFDLVLAGLAIAGLSYCINKALADWRDGYVRVVIWGCVAALSCLVFLALVLADFVVKGLTI